MISPQKTEPPCSVIAHISGTTLCYNSRTAGLMEHASAFMAEFYAKVGAASKRTLCTKYRSSPTLVQYRCGALHQGERVCLRPREPPIRPRHQGWLHWQHSVERVQKGRLVVRAGCRASAQSSEVSSSTSPGCLSVGQCRRKPA